MTNSLSVQHISIFCWILKVYYFMHLTDFKKRSNDIRIWKKRLGVIFANSLPIFTYSMYNIWKFKYDRIIWDMVNHISLNNRIFSGYDLWEITNRLKSTYIPETIYYIYKIYYVLREKSNYVSFHNVTSHMLILYFLSIYIVWCFRIISNDEKNNYILTFDIKGC